MKKSKLEVKDYVEVLELLSEESYQGIPWQRRRLVANIKGFYRYINENIPHKIVETAYGTCRGKEKQVPKVHPKTLEKAEEKAAKLSLTNS